MVDAHDEDAVIGDHPVVDGVRKLAQQHTANALRSQDEAAKQRLALDLIDGLLPRPLESAPSR